LGREHDDRRAVLESMGGAQGEERCSYRPQQHGCDVNGIVRGEAGRSILLLLGWRRQVACPNKLALVTFQQAGRPPVGSCSAGGFSRSSQPARPCFHKPRRRSTINWTFRNKPYCASNNITPQPHESTRNHASRRPKTQDPQNQRQSRRLNFLRFRFPPGIPDRLPQAQSAARRTWTRAGAKKGEGSGSAGEKRGAHKVLPKISDQRNNMLT